jgi:hypothetical protein
VDRRSTGNLETWQSWDVYHGIHHIGSSLLPSELVKILDPNFPPMTKVTRFIIFLIFRYAYLFFLHLVLSFMPSFTFCTYFCLNACILGKSHGRTACFKFIHLSKLHDLKCLFEHGT